MAGGGPIIGGIEYEMGGGGRRRVRSNGSADKHKLYAGIAVAGVAAGAAVAVSTDPIYDAEKKARGKEVKRNMDWKREYMPLADISPGGQLDVEMHDIYRKQGMHVKANQLEMEARRKFEANPIEHQQRLVKAMENPLPEIKGSFRAKALIGLRKLATKL